MINYNILKSFYKLIRKQGIKKAIEALEKQIPQLPYNHRKATDGIVIAQCSICDQEIFFPESYCVCCGHAIDWTDWKTKSEENMMITGESIYCKNCGYQYKWEGSYPILHYCPKCNKKINWNDYDILSKEKINERI